VSHGKIVDILHGGGCLLVFFSAWELTLTHWNQRPMGSDCNPSSTDKVTDFVLPWTASFFTEATLTLLFYILSMGWNVCENLF